MRHIEDDDAPGVHAFHIGEIERVVDQRLREQGWTEEEIEESRGQPDDASAFPAFDPRSWDGGL